MAQTPKMPGSPATPAAPKQDAKPAATKPPPPPPPPKAGAAPPPSPRGATGARAATEAALASDKKKRPTLPPLPGRSGAKPGLPVPPNKAAADAADARRAHKRFDLSVAADVRVGDEVLPAKTRNLSEGGAGLEIATPLERGTELWVSLFLLVDEIEDEGKEPFAVHGTVAWRADLLPGKSWSVGVKFAELDGEHLGELKTFLGKLGK